ncbi:MAG: polyprenyl synthetase family protein [Verrucomicrobiota bacterium]
MKSSQTKTDIKLGMLLDPIAGHLARVETKLAEQVASFDAGIGDYVQYVIGVAGKRLRPTLALLAGGATGRIGEDHITLGVIVELIHVATLVHDDILDEADLRHGLPTANSRWGHEISVLLGDCLFAHALSLAASYPTTNVCRKVSLATNTVCSGEILQTQRRFDPALSIDKYLEIIDMKTGALFAVSCELGAELNNLPPHVVKGMREFGSNLGIAYQIYDDCVDIFGQERQAGKSLGTDMKNGKLTLPWLLLLQHTNPENRPGVAELIFRGNADDRARLLALVTGNGVLSESLAMVEKYITRAENNLADLPANAHTQTLSSLLNFIATKTQLLLKKEEVAA